MSAPDVATAKAEHARAEARDGTLELQGVRIRFGGNLVVRDLTLTALPGEVTALIGPNGAGKTTVLNAISGFVKAHSGRIDLRGAPLLGKPPAAIVDMGVGRTFQSGHVFGELTVRENLMGGYGLRGLDTAWREFAGTPRGRRERLEAERLAEQMAQRLGLVHALDGRAADLPAGAQKLVDLGRALVARPPLLLADEPAAGLSPAERQAVASLFRDYVADGEHTVLLVDHDMRFVMGISHTVYVLNFGELIAAGAPAAVQNDEKVIAAYLGSE